MKFLDAFYLKSSLLKVFLLLLRKENKIRNTQFVVHIFRLKEFFFAAKSDITVYKYMKHLLDFLIMQSYCVTLILQMDLFFFFICIACLDLGVRRVIFNVFAIYIISIKLVGTFFSVLFFFSFSQISCNSLLGSCWCHVRNKKDLLSNYIA